MKGLKFSGGLLIFVIGLYVASQGYSTYTFSARSSDGSMGINKLGFFIPATDSHLHTTGTIFVCIGLALMIAASCMMYLILKKKRKQR